MHKEISTLITQRIAEAKDLFSASKLKFSGVAVLADYIDLVPHTYKYLRLDAWRFVGLSDGALRYILSGLDEEIEDRIAFCREFARAQSISPVNVYNSILSILRGLSAMSDAQASPSIGKTLSKMSVARLVMDLTRLVLEDFNVMNVIGALCSAYAIFVEGYASPQSLDAIAISALSFLLPASLFEIIKRMSMLSSVKLLDDVSCFSTLFNSVVDFLKQMCTYIPSLSVKEVLVKFLDQLPFGQKYQWFNKVKRLLDMWHKDKKYITRPEFVQPVEEHLHVLRDPEMSDWGRRCNSVKVLLEEFKHLSRSLAAYKATTRVEPVCFVFEGPPGVFKSTVMTQLLQAAGMTVYTHNIKPVGDGKDHYDAYNGEDVYASDDVGQMGLGQYRPFINFVSCVKCPLECADSNLKDTKFFCSPIIMFTTNAFSTLEETSFSKQDCISSPKALWRRGFVFYFTKSHVRFQWYDVTVDNWRTDFPPGVPEGTPTSFPRLGERKYLLKWMFDIIMALKKQREEFRDDNQLSAEEVAFIRGEPDVYHDALAQTRVLGFVDGFLEIEEEELSWTEKVQEYCWSFLSSLQDWGQLHLVKVLGATFVLALVYSMCKWYKSIKGEAVPQHLNLIREAIPALSTPNSTIVSTVCSQLKSVLISNGEERSRTVGLVLGHSIVVPNHSVPHETGFVTVTNANGSTIEWDKLPYTIAYVDTQADVAILQVPLKMGTAYSNLSHLVGGKAVQELATPLGSTQLETLVKKGNVTQYRKLYATREIVVSNGAVVKYPYQVEGLCGSLLMDKSKGIMGMHVAVASDNYGVGSVWPSYVVEQIKSVLEKDKTHYWNFSPHADQLEGMSVLRTDTSCFTSVPKTTSYKKTPLYGTFPVERAPANLSVHGVGTVRVMAEKSFLPIGEVHPLDLRFAEEWLDSIVLPFGSLTEKEVVSGTAVLAGINKDSVNGYLRKPDKEVYFDFDKSELTPYGRERVAKLELDIANGVLKWEDFVFCETLKDELRNLNKVDTPRTFRVGTVELQYTTKRVFGKLMEHIVENRWRNQIMIGCNPLKDFDRIAKILARKNKRWCADVPKFDGKMLAQLQHSVAKVLARKSTEPSVAETILRNLPNCPVAILNRLYLTTHSMPSGCWLTALVNSMINRMMTAMWFSNVCRKVCRIPTLMEFEEIVDFVLGDDKTNATDSVLPGMDMLGMRDYFVSIGSGLTNSDKSEVDRPYHEWEELSFLKRSFTWDPRFAKYICPLEVRSMTNSMSWYDSKKDLEVVLYDKVLAFQREAYLHQNYSELMKVLKSNCEAHGLTDVAWFTEEQLYAMVMKGDPAFLTHNANIGLSGMFGLTMTPRTWWDNCVEKIGSLVGRPVAGTAQSTQTRDSRVDHFQAAHPERSDRDDKSNPLSPFDNKERGVSIVAESNFTPSEVNTKNTAMLDKVAPVLAGKDSAIRTRTAIENPAVYDAQVHYDNVPQELRGDFSSLIGKPFHLGSFTWNTSTARYGQVFKIDFPSALLTLNRQASAPFDLMSLYRLRGCLLIQTAGTPMHGGGLIVASLPRGITDATTTRKWLHSFQSAPHAYLYANQQTAACLELPFYSNTKLRWTPSVSDSQDETFIGPYGTDDYLTVRAMVVSPLSVGGSASTAVTVTVSLVFHELDFFSPKADYALPQSAEEPPEPPRPKPTRQNAEFAVRLVVQMLAAAVVNFLFRVLTLDSSDDAIPQSMSSVATGAIDGLFSVGRKFMNDCLDTGRGWIRQYTGLHSPNQPVPEHRGVVATRQNPNQAEQTTYYYKLDPYGRFNGVSQQFYGETREDECLVSNMVSKPMHVSTFSISTSDVAGRVLFTAPISPLMFRELTAGAASTVVSAPIDKLSRMARFYRGSLQLTLQNFGTSFHMFKILVVKEYYSSAQMTTTTPPMQKALNLPSDSIEFSAGGQLQTITIPMASLFDYVPLSADFRTNGMTHGRIVMYLLHPLVTNGTVATAVEVAVHLAAGPDFMLYGYATDGLFKETIAVPTLIMELEDPKTKLKVQLDTEIESDMIRIAGKRLDHHPQELKPDVVYYSSNMPVTTSRITRAAYDFKKAHFTYYTKGNFFYYTDESKEKSDKKSRPGFEPETWTRVDSAKPQSADDCGAPTPFVQADACALEDTEMSLSSPLTDAFRPLVHMRDIARRMQLCYLSTFDPVYQADNKSTLSINIASILLNGTNVSFPTGQTATVLNPIQIVSSMFQGFRGGVKLKIVIKGAKDAAVWYLPPTPNITVGPVGPGQYRLKASSEITPNVPTQEALDNRFNNLAILGDQYHGPFLETADFRVSSSHAEIAGNAVDVEDTMSQGSVTVLEAEIPYMNVARWVGLMGQQFGQSFVSDYYLSSLGNLELGFTSTFGVARDGTPLKRPVTVKIYAGAADDARFHFQNFSMPLYLPSIDVGNQLSSFQAIGSTIASTANPSSYYTSNV